MAITSVRIRRRVWEVAFAATVMSLAYLIQLTVLTNIKVNDTLASLPIAFTIVWGCVFGSPLKGLSPDELRSMRVGEVVARQAFSGSVSGALVGGFFAALYSSVLPFYPIGFPIVGWLAGYFSLRSFNQATLLVLPLVLVGSILAETIAAVQLSIAGRGEVLQQLSATVFQEAIMNCLISPFLFFPMRGWAEFIKMNDSSRAQQ